MNDDWQAFRRINESRRAIRQFDGLPIDVAALKEVLDEALKAPSSGNIQPFEFHLVTEPALKAAVAEACNAQEAAKSSSALVVLVSSARIAKTSLNTIDAGVESWPERSRTYHRGNSKMLRRFFSIAPFPLFGLLRSAIAYLLPVLSLLPFGPSGVHHWLARNSIFAAQTLMLAASARGFDTCPMEGFNAMKVGRLLNLHCSSVVPLVIAVGYRTENARVEPRLRRSLNEAVVVH